MVTPLVVILDLDGTIIGDIRQQITTYDIHNQIKTTGAKLKYNFGDYKTKLNGGIIRPFFGEFIRRLKKDIPHIEFFVYTASEQKWAMHIINNIEKVCAIKFNRPLLTRKDCLFKGNNILKSVAKVKPQILRALKRKYGVVDLKDRCLIVDNARVFVEQDQPYNILCKTYNFIYPENLGAIISHDEYSQHYNIINRVLGDGDNPSYFDFQKRFYEKYVERLRDVSATNKEYEHDTFFKVLRRAITKLIIVKKHGRFDVGGVSYIRRQLDKSVSTGKKRDVAAFF